MKTIILVTTLAVLLTGCRTVYESEVPAGRFPFVPTSLAEFVRSPKNGVYALPDVAPMPAYYFRSNVLVVRGSRIWLSRFQNGLVSTSEWDLVEFKTGFPADAELVDISGPKTETEMKSLLGKATHEGRNFIPYVGIESHSTKFATYNWFTVLPTSEIMFMTITVDYVRSTDDHWTATSLRWERRAGRNLASNQVPEYTARRLADPEPDVRIEDNERR